LRSVIDGSSVRSDCDANLIRGTTDRRDHEPSCALGKELRRHLLREMIGFTAQRLMELEVEALTAAAHGERSPDRINQRNGYRDRL
jgi:mutator family transposase